MPIKVTSIWFRESISSYFIYMFFAFKLAFTQIVYRVCKWKTRHVGFRIGSNINQFSIPSFNTFCESKHRKHERKDEREANWAPVIKPTIYPQHMVYTNVVNACNLSGNVARYLVDKTFLKSEGRWQSYYCFSVLSNMRSILICTRRELLLLVI